jgi:hypothetical protein
MKQTAVEWLAEQMLYPQNFNPYIEQAKEMEKQQIIDARVNGVCEGIDIGARPIGETITEDISKNHEIYYNEIFKNK